jgi:hypothetical protein
MDCPTNSPQVLSLRTTLEEAIGGPRTGEAPERFELDESARERLRALGYLN